MGARGPGRRGSDTTRSPALRNRSAGMASHPAPAMRRRPAVVPL